MNDVAFSIPAAKLRALVSNLFRAAGVSPADAEQIADGLIEAELEGSTSHGVMLIDMYLDRIRHGSVSTTNRAEIVSDRQAAVVLDAGHTLGQISASYAIALAVERAERYGVGIVAVRHGFHFGTARRYAVKATESGCIGVVACNTRPLMPAPGGAERVVGNNPLAIAVPVEGPMPLVLDMATSEAAMGKIRMAEKRGHPIPDSWAVDAAGAPTTDPAQAIAGMLLPVGGPKGFGLAFLIDLVCGLLSGGAFGQNVRPLYGDFATPYDCSHLFLAIDVAHFCDVAQFRRAASDAAEAVRAGQRAPGVDQLFTPGEPEWRRQQQADGVVKLGEAVVSMLARYCSELGVSAEALNANRNG